MYAITFPEVKYPIGTIASGSFIEFETSEIFKKLYDNKIEQGIQTVIGGGKATCSCFIPKGGMAISGAYYDNIPCWITYYRGTSENIRVYVNNENGVNKKVKTFFGTANLNDEIKNIGIDPVKIALGHLQEAEEDMTALENLFPNGQVLKDVARMESSL